MDPEPDAKRNIDRDMQGKIYLVGGAVRDELLELPVNERDWVVVGSSVEAMLAAGFRQIDADFPVFLHPQTGEEYALARRETKTGVGYRGFVIDASPEVTLLEDLQRRDLTINAMARDEGGKLIDPFGGQADLAEGRLRHITPAFAEDPLRILRVARFAAKLGGHGFRLAHATHRLMKQMVAEGAVAEWLPQRTGREMTKALVCEQPWRFFEVLQACDALARVAPSLALAMEAAGHTNGKRVSSLEALQRASVASEKAVIRFAALFLQTEDAPEMLETGLAPGTEAIALLGAARNAWRVLQEALDAKAWLELFQMLRAWHRGGLFEQVLQVLRAQPGMLQRAELFRTAREAALSIDSNALMARGYKGPELGQALARERWQAIDEVLKGSASA